MLLFIRMWNELNNFLCYDYLCAWVQTSSFLSFLVRLLLLKPSHSFSKLNTQGQQSNKQIGRRGANARLQLKVKKHNTRRQNFSEVQPEWNCRQETGTQGQICHPAGKGRLLRLLSPNSYEVGCKGLGCRRTTNIKVTGLTSEHLSGPYGNLKAHTWTHN